MDDTVGGTLVGEGNERDKAGEALADRLCADQLARWRSGERVPVEAYLEQYPELNDDAEACFELLYGEYLTRESLGEVPDVAEFQSRFPRFAGRLHRQLELHRALQGDGPDTWPDAEGGGEPGSEPANRSRPLIPGFVVLGELGRGAMGVVFEARQQGLNRPVALKVIQAWAYADPAVAARFRAEAETAGRFQHPHIIQVFEVGEHDGQGYLVLEYAAGGSLLQRLAREPMEPREAAALIETLARAVDYAHRRGIVHRDLKPANVVLTEDGLPKITDFGLAKLLEQDAGLTRSGDILGTPSYMAPEQVRGLPGDVSPATDVYALGAILYEALTGRPPFQGSSPLSTLDQVVERAPLPPGRLRSQTPRELETVCLKCLEKEPRRRYVTAADLADDLRRFLEGRPVLARRLGPIGRAAKWCRREPALACLALALLLAVVVGFAGMSYLWRRAVRQASGEAQERRRAAAAEEVARDHLYVSQIAHARLEWRLNDVARAGLILDRCEPDRRGWEWRYLSGLNQTELLASEDIAFPVATAVAFSPDGSRLVVLCINPYQNANPCRIEAWDTRNGHRLWQGDGPALACRLSIHPDGRLLAVSGEEGLVQFREVESGRLVRSWQSDGTPAFLPDGLRLVAGGGDALTLFNLEGHPLRRLPSVGGRATPSPDGRRLAVSGPEAVVILDAENGAEMARLPHGPGESEARKSRYFSGEGPGLAFSPDGSRLVVATSPVRIWDLTTGRPLHALVGHDGQVLGVAFRPDGREVATAGADATVRLWDVETGDERSLLRGHPEWIPCVAFHPEGWSLASGGGHAGDLRLWDLTREAEYLTLPDAHAFAVAFDPTGHQLRTVRKGGRLDVWAIEAGRLTEGPPVDLTQRWLSPATLADFADDGSRVATVADDRRLIKLWDSATGRELTTLRGLEEPAIFVDCGVDGRRVAALGTKPGRDNPVRRVVRVWEAASGRTLASFVAARYPVPYTHGAVAIDPRGDRVAFDDYEGGTPDRPPLAVIRVCKLPGGREVLKLDHLRQRIISLKFDRDGRRLAASDIDGSFSVWDTTTGALLLRVQPHDDWSIFHFAFSPDGRRLAGVDREKVRVWDLHTGEELLALRIADRRPFDGGSNPTLAWSPDGLRLASTNWDGSVSVWDGSQPPTNPADRIEAARSRVFAWHLRESGRAIADGRPGVADFHLDRLQTLEPPDAASRQRLSAQLRQRDQMAKTAHPTP